MTASAPDRTATARRAAPVTADMEPPTIDVTRLRVAIARVSRSLRRHELAGLTPTQLSALATVEQAARYGSATSRRPRRSPRPR